MLQINDIMLIRSCGSAKTVIQLRGMSEQLTIDASFEQIKNAINNKQTTSAQVQMPLKLAEINKI